MLNKTMIDKVLTTLRLVSIVVWIYSARATERTEQNDRRGYIDTSNSIYQNDSLLGDRLRKPINDDTVYLRSPSISSTKQNSRRSHLDYLISKHEFLSFHRMIHPPLKNNTGYVRDPSVLSTKKNDRFRLLDDLYIENEKELKSFRRMKITNITGCVRNQNGLEIAIMNAPDYSLILTNINICKEYILIDASTPNSDTGFRGIHVINKYINFRCIINTNKKCNIDARGKSRHLYVESSTLIFNRMTFMNGYEVEEYQPKGGSLHLNSSNVVMNDCDFLSNAIISQERDGGGAIFCDTDCNMKLVNVKMINNSASRYGGAIHSEGNVQMKNVLFQSSRAQFGGAAEFSYGSVVQMDNVSCINNTAEQTGGAFHLDGKVVMTNVLFKNNTSNFGGAVFSYGYVEMKNVTFTNNYAGSIGGAIVADYETTMDNITVSNNYALLWGGGIYLYGQNHKISNSLLENNTAGTYGGAISSFSSMIDLQNVVFTNINAQEGTLLLGNLKAYFTNVSILSSIQDVNSCDILFAFDYDSDGYGSKYSRLNLRPPPPQRQQQQMQRPIQTKQEGYVNISQQSTFEQQLIKACVTTFVALRRQVRICNTSLDTAPCVINICRTRIAIPKIAGGSNPIDLSNKNVLINCQLSTNKRCSIDGQGLSNFFYGYNVVVTVHNVMFVNGYSSGSGGALDIAGDSLVNLFNCSFVNNSAQTGGAIMINNTTMYMSGTQSSFINNTGKTPALAGFSSDLHLYDTIFEGNRITKYGNGILLFDSTIDVYNTTFSESKVAPLTHQYLVKVLAVWMLGVFSNNL